MSEQLFNSFSITIQEKLYEKKFPDSQITVYLTDTFGKLLMVNGKIILTEYDSFLYHEMMAHPCLFTHPAPFKVAIMGNYFGILQEVIKHVNVKEITCVLESDELDEAVSHYFSDLYQIKTDNRIQYAVSDPFTWLSQHNQARLDIIMAAGTDKMSPEHYRYYYNALQPNGLLIQPCQASLLHFKTLQPLYQTARDAGFSDCQILHFPQPSYPSGCRAILMAAKRSVFSRIREKDIFNRPFSTRYYNFDVHKAALALPQFLKEAP